MVLQSLSRSPPVKRTRSFSFDDPDTARKGKNYGETVGGSAAECTAVCCCFPLAVIDLLVLGLYKVPTGLCKKACTKRKKQNRKNQEDWYTTPSMEGLGTDLDKMMLKGEQSGDDDGSTVAVDPTFEGFAGTGFWRVSASSRD